MVSDEEIREFMKKYFPGYEDNLDLGRILYYRYKGKGNKRGNGKGEPPEYEEVEVEDIEDMSPGSYIIVKGITGRVMVREYEGCAVCGRKHCTNPEHQEQGTTTWYNHLILLHGRHGGRATLKYLGKNRLEIEEGDEVVIKGRIEINKSNNPKYRGQKEVRILDYVVSREAPSFDEVNNNAEEIQEEEEQIIDFTKEEKVEKEKPEPKPKRQTSNVSEGVKKILDVLRVTEVSERVFKNLLERYKVSEEEIKPYIKTITKNKKKYVVLK